jgi:hypothetical protein
MREVVLDEMHQRILSEIEEAGEEDVCTLLNTVIAATGAAKEVADFRTAVEGLIRADLVRVAIDRDATGRLQDQSRDASLDVISHLNSNVIYDEGRGVWKDIEDAGPPYDDFYPYIVTTELGQEKAFEILDARGYQWWREKK